MNLRKGKPRWKMLGGILLVSALVALLTAPASATFSGRNGRIAYVANWNRQIGSPAEIWTADADGTNAAKLVDISSPAGYHCAGWFSGTGSGPRWAPDGSLIAFADAGDLWVVAPDGAGLTRLTSVGGNRNGTPVWSPDGSKIAVVIDLVLYVVDTDGGGSLAIPSQHGGWFTDFSPPSWSKKGDEIAAVIEQWGAGPHDVYVIKADGSDQINVTNDGQSEHPAWSPNGAEIAFTSGAGGSSVQAVKPNGSKRRIIADLPTPDFWPQWSPNGSSLLFTSYDGSNFLVLVHITKSHGKQIIDLPSGSSICDAVWSPDGSEILFVDAFGDLWRVDRRARSEPTSVGMAGLMPGWQSIRGS